MTDVLLQHIVSCTDKKMEILTPTEKYPDKVYAKLIDIVDWRAFLGIVYTRGIYHMNGHRIDTLFSDIHGHLVFSATISRQRFQFILANLTFDDAEERPARWQRH